MKNIRWITVFIIVSLAVITSAIVAAAGSDDWLEMKEHHALMQGDDWEEHMKGCHSENSKATHGSSGMLGHM